MVCNLCGVHDATIHLTEISNLQMVEIHLCEACAQEKGTEFKTHFNAADLLSNLADPSMWMTLKEKPTAKCPQCAMTYDDLSKKGRLGCSACYQAFEKFLEPLIRRVQKSTQHVGKIPGKTSQAPRPEVGNLVALQQKLRQCIQDEKFEEAAALRDMIKKIEVKTRKPKGSSGTRKPAK